jgi:hypothetical protein
MCWATMGLCSPVALLATHVVIALESLSLVVPIWAESALTCHLSYTDFYSFAECCHHCSVLSRECVCQLSLHV